MTMVNGPSTAPGDGTAPSAQAGGDVPSRADGVLLIGEMKGSGYRQPPALARRGDGQTIQLTTLVYLVLEAIDGASSYEDIARTVSTQFGRTVSAENVRSLVTDQLRPAGLVTLADGSEPEVRKSNPLLALRFKYAVTNTDRTRRLTAPFTVLFNPLVVTVVLAAWLAVSWWVLLHKGLASATNEAFAKPGLLFLVVVVTVLSAGFHEFGHAAAARRAGAEPGAMGAGIYLVWPAFYTDVTDSYRLGRGGRVLTDLGGLYFNAIVAVGITGVWWLTRYDALLLIVATQILQMLRQLTPLVRFDGYHVLADVTGVPDLFHRIKPTLLGVLPWRWRHPDATVLKPWARLVVTAWVFLVVPVLACAVYLMVITLPRVLGTAWAGAHKQVTLIGHAWSEADFLAVAGHAFGVVAVMFPILAVAIMLGRLVRQIATRTWVATAERPLRRALAGLLALALVAGLAFAWWPRDGAYRPIQAYEGGTLTQAAQRALPRAATGLRVGDQGVINTAWAKNGSHPTRAHPQLAVVLLPSKDGGANQSNAQPWVFPFNRPLAPGPGDNQAMAVNTADGTTSYDVAFALVWIDDDSPAMNKNEAYAFADCQDCAAVAIGFQVVLVTGDNHVAVPQNISAAVNYDCVNCLTYALAVQLFVTVDHPLDDATMKKLQDLWQQIAEYGANIASVPLDEIQGQLNDFENQILAIVGVQTPAAAPTPSPGASVSATDGTSPTADVSDSAAPDPTSAGSGTPAESSSSDPSPSGSETPSPSSEPTPTTPESSATPSP
jgi:putative peptide zinc metalloprotease protein